MRRRIAKSIARLGWPAGLETVLQEIEDPAVASRIQSDLWLRHTAWKGLFDPRRRGAALVSDPGYGSLAISLAHDFDCVWAVCEDPDLAAILRARAGYLGVQNIKIVRNAEMAHPVDAAAVYVPDRSPVCASIAPLHGKLKPHGQLYVGLHGRHAGLTAWHAVRQLRAIFPLVTAYRCCTADGLTGTDELALGTPGRGGLRARAAALRASTFGVIASKDASSISLIDSVLAESARTLAGGSPLVPERLVFACPNGLTVLTGDEGPQGRLIIRIPFDKQSVDRNEVNRRALEALESGDSSLSRSIPRHVLSGQVSGQRYFVESAVAGEAAAVCLRGKARSETVSAALSWITDLHRATAQRRPADPALLERLVAVPVTRAFEALRFPERRAGFERLRQLLTAALASERIPLVHVHGDYSVDNVLLSGSPLGVTGVFDWDLAEPEGLPLLDVLYFLATAARTLTGQPIGAVFVNQIFPLRFDQTAHAALERYCHALDIPERLLAPLSVLAWLHHAGVRQYNPERYRLTPDAAGLGGDAFRAALSLLERSAAGFASFGRKTQRATA